MGYHVQNGANSAISQNRPLNQIDKEIMAKKHIPMLNLCKIWTYMEFSVDLDEIIQIILNLIIVE